MRRSRMAPICGAIRKRCVSQKGRKCRINCRFSTSGRALQISRPCVRNRSNNTCHCPPASTVKRIRRSRSRAVGEGEVAKSPNGSTWTAAWLFDRWPRLEIAVIGPLCPHASSVATTSAMVRQVPTIRTRSSRPIGASASIAQGSATNLGCPSNASASMTGGAGGGWLVAMTRMSALRLWAASVSSFHPFPSSSTEAIRARTCSIRPLASKGRSVWLRSDRKDCGRGRTGRSPASRPGRRPTRHGRRASGRSGPRHRVPASDDPPK